MLTRFDKLIIIISIIICIVIILNPPLAMYHPETGYFVEQLNRMSLNPLARIHFWRLFFELVTVIASTGAIVAIRTTFGRNRSSSGTRLRPLSKS